MQHYLASDGSADARAAMQSGGYWQVQGTRHDGRRNEDVLAMLEQVRALKDNGRDISVLPFDTAPGATRNHHERDRAMADYLREQFLANPDARFVVLAGNVHAMVRKPGYAPPEMQQPMGAYLIDLDPYSINISARSGQFWGCAGGQCAPKDERPAQSASGPARPDAPYHYQLVLQQFSVARLLGR
jgi:erythromycin esterase-like protein